jgi:hypothetical protein
MVKKEDYISMKKAEEYIPKVCAVEEILHSNSNKPFWSKEFILKIIKQAQIDTIKATVQACADNADAGFEPINWLVKQYVSIPFIEGEDYEVYVIKSSILEVADKLIKELE